MYTTLRPSLLSLFSLKDEQTPSNAHWRAIKTNDEILKPGLRITEDICAQKWPDNEKTDTKQKTKNKTRFKLLYF